MAGRLIAAALLLVVARPGRGEAPVILANRANRDLTVTATTADGQPRRVTIERGDLAVLTVAGATTITYPSLGQWQTTRVGECSAYTFTAVAGTLRLESVYAGAASKPAAATDAAEGVLASPAMATLTVKVLVDRQEPATRPVWEERLRKRIALASEILERQCRVRLVVSAFDTWDSSYEARNLGERLADFERKVPTRPAQLALGFSSRPLPADSASRSAAATAIPLHTHIVFDESLQLAEPQRLETLLHELGHYLGAVHTKDADSVMRLSPADARSLDRNFRIGYDPFNALIMNLVAREAVRVPPVRKLGALSGRTRDRLAQLYKEAAQQLSDETTEKYLRLLEDVPRALPTRTPDPLVASARSVVAAVAAAADAAAELGLADDRLTDHCVRAAAAAAGKLPEGQRVPAFVLGLAVALDSSELLRKAELTRGLWERVESDDERKERLKVVGQPTLHGRHVLARHFVVAAALTAIAGSKAADPGGIVRELFEGEAGGDYSFAELAAELAGAAFARSLAEEPNRLAGVAASFTVADYVPSPAGLEESLTRDEFTRRYGSITDERFRQRASELRRRIARLPAYKSK